MLRNRRSKSNRHFYILIGVSVCLNAYLWQTKLEANKEHKERDAVLFDDIKFVLQRLKDTQSSFSNKTSQLTDGDYYATLANRDGSCEDLKEYARDARANLHEVSDEISALYEYVYAFTEETLLKTNRIGSYTQRAKRAQPKDSQRPLSVSERRALIKAARKETRLEKADLQ